MDNQKIRQRFEAQWSARKIIEYTWNLVGHFVVPLRTDDFFQEQWTEHSVRWDRPRRDVYDSEAILAAENLAASVHSGLTSSLVRWFNIRFRIAALNHNQEARAWLEAYGINQFTIQTSHGSGATPARRGIAARERSCQPGADRAGLSLPEQSWQ